MLRNLLKQSLAGDRIATDLERGSLSLQITLWMLWTLCIGLVGYLSRRADIVAQHPVNLLGLVIHCVLAGLVGLIAMTMIEMRLEPWRFMD